MTTRGLGAMASNARIPDGDAVRWPLHADLATLTARAGALAGHGHGVGRHLLAQGLHPADAAVPRRLPLLHVRAAAAQRRGGLPLARRGARHRPRRQPRPAARRRCSRSATSRSCATRPHARRCAALGHPSTLSYLAEMARAVLEETGLLPHLNPGVMDARRTSRGCARCRSRRASCWRRSSDRLCAARRAALRLARQAARRCGSRRSRAGRRARVPFTTGLLIGIGETRGRAHRGAARDPRPATTAHGHIQEVIIQNFRAKPGTRMADAPAPRRSTSSCGPSPWRACSSGRR